ncbi:MAG TPA: hypothetical protein DEO32_06255 [Ruminococcaceae bacterium]|nr:hypothetical protein [Oscillospiraceae bacterium]
MNDIEMLNCILQSAEMGCQGITSVRRRVRKKSVDNVLCNQLMRYGKIYSAANSMLKSRGASARHINPVAKTMTRIAAQRDLQRDASSAHIAEMMIKGNTMGVNKMVRNLREYDRANPNITLLAKKMLDTEEEHIRELRAFI